MKKHGRSNLRSSVFLVICFFILSFSVRLAIANPIPSAPPGKTLPTWPVPTKLMVVHLKSGDVYTVMTIAALQGLVNRTAPQGTMIYIEMDDFPDQSWREYYVEHLSLTIEEKTVDELLDWVIANTDIQYYIVIDPYSNTDDFDLSRSSTINIASTMAGILGDAVLIHPDKIDTMEEHGFHILPDSYCASFGAGGSELFTPEAFDLRNQWQIINSNAPWATRQDAYAWALDYLLPLCDHHAILLQPENYYNSWFGFTPWTLDYSIGTRIFHFDFNPDLDSIPDPELPIQLPIPPYDRLFFEQLLQASGPFTMLRGWTPYSEWDLIQIMSEYHGFHAGSNQMANSSVHMALSPLFTEPFSQRVVMPDQVTLDPNKIYLTFTVSDGDQFGVLYRYYQHYENGVETPLWLNYSARGDIPINWSMNGLAYYYCRGVMRYLFDTATDKDYFTAYCPVGYAHFTYGNFGDDLAAYDAFANSYLPTTAMPVAYFAGNGISYMSDQTIEINMQGLPDAIALMEGYSGTNSYQGINWPEVRSLTPYILNTAGIGGANMNGVIAAQQIVNITNNVPYNQNCPINWRPLFMHFQWSNWDTTLNQMKECMDYLNQYYPGQYELVGLPEFVALAQKAKLTGQYPMEFYPGSLGIAGSEGPYFFENNGSTTNIIRPPYSEYTLFRATTESNSVTYKFNIAPAQEATLTVDIEGTDYRIDASSNNQNWVRGIITGQNSVPVTRQADITSYLNNNGSVYIRVCGESKIWHVKVDYVPPNQPPQFVDPPSTEVIPEGQALSFIVNATDPEQDPLTYSATGLPDGANFDVQNREFSWIPSYSQGRAEPYIVTFTVTDNHNPPVNLTVGITVLDNQPPVFVDPPQQQQEIAEDEALTFAINAADPETDLLVYSASGLPEGATFIDQTFSWTPNYSQGREDPYIVNFSVTDNHNPAVTLEVAITVTDVNRAPEMEPIPPVKMRAGDIATTKVVAHDPDNDPIAFSLNVNAPGKVKLIDHGNGIATVIYQSGPSSHGYYNAVVTASDGHLQDSKNITVFVYKKSTGKGK